MTTPTPTPRTAVDILRAARELIAEPKAWTQRAFGRDEDGMCCDSLHPDAVCWCAGGALTKAANGHGLIRSKAREQLYAAIGCADIVDFNDEHTHAEVLSAFDRAITLAEQSVQS